MMKDQLMTQNLGIFLSLFVGVLLTAIRCEAEEPIDKVIFGSCIRQERPAPLLEVMAKQRVDVVVFLGDNIYGDTEDMEVLSAKYDQLHQLPGFSTLFETSTVLATWDDHDYGVNDGGASYPQREASEEIFLDFWNYPENAAERKRPGIYGSRIIGPLGKRVQFILLDTRYFRSPLKTGERRVGGPYYPDDDPDKTMLGKAQWKWLAEQLRKPAEIRILASSIQCLPSQAGQECWANLPRERERLLKLIEETKAHNLIILSGDRHWSEVSRIETSSQPIYEFTSSSINQPHPRGTPTENENRFGDKTYHKQNYGLININWESQPPEVDVQIRDLDDKVQIKTNVLIQQGQ